MVTMNDQIRKVVSIELAKRGMNQADLADKLNISKQHLSRMVMGKSSGLPKTWEKVLDELELNLLVVPRSKLERISKAVDEDR